MSSTNAGPTTTIDTGHSDQVWAVAFHPDGKHLISGNGHEIQQWRLEDGQEIRRHTGMDVNAISVSPDQKWIVCGTGNGAIVWDAEMREKVIDVEDTINVGAIDISPDSTRLATGSSGSIKKACIWSIPSGERLLGPLQHSDHVSGIKFSPNGDQIATAELDTAIHIFDSGNGDRLVTINIVIPYWGPVVPIAWSSDGQHIYAVSRDKKVRCFDVSSGDLFAESLILLDNAIYSIASAANGKFIAAVSEDSISFLDTSTLALIGPAIKDRWSPSIAISSDNTYLATGRRDGKITIHDLGKILPDLYGPFHVSTSEEGHDSESPNVENPGRSGVVESGGHGEDSDDLLEHEVPSSAPAAQFDFDEPPSPMSDYDTRPVGLSHADAVESSQGHSIFKKWRQWKSKKDSPSHDPGRRSGKLDKPTDRRSPSHSPARVDATNKRPSRMAAAERNARTSTGFPRRRKRKPPTNAVANHQNEGASGGRSAAESSTSNTARQGNSPSQPPATGVHVTHQQGSSEAAIAISIPTMIIRLPTWMLCIRSGAHDETERSR